LVGARLKGHPMMFGMSSVCAVCVFTVALSIELTFP
jgi:hypothetical protein